MGTWQGGCPPWSDLGDTCPFPPHPVKTPRLQESGHPVSASPSFATRKAFPLSHLRPSFCLSPPGAQWRSKALEEGALSPPVGPHGGTAQRDLAFPCALRWVGRQALPAVCACPQPACQAHPAAAACTAGPGGACPQGLLPD